MKIKELFENINYTSLNSQIGEYDIEDIAIDSRQVKDGSVFVCMDGFFDKGVYYLQQAIDKNAKVILTNKPILNSENEIVVEDVRKAYSLISKNMYGKACDSLFIIGVTGTNGKTTITNQIADVLNRSGRNAAVVGTLGVKYNGAVYDTGFTTPDPHVLHKYFKDMAESGVKYVVMEASAHAIALKKLAGIKFEVAVLTNITQDHLDFFETMENYAKVKRSFITSEFAKDGLIYGGDEKVMEALKESDIDVYTYGTSRGKDFSAFDIEQSFKGSGFACKAMHKLYVIDTPFIGDYNIENTLASIGVCSLLGLKVEDIKNGIANSYPAEGRFNVINKGNKNIVIDYAHTPDGLEKVLTAARKLTSGKLITVFGCGGNRDKRKRPIMGCLASKLSDKVYVTSDNPRYEEPMDIIKEVLKGVKGQHEVCEDRRKAIKFALDECGKDDLIVIAGKGGENYQDIKGEKFPYNDSEVVNSYLDFLEEDAWL